MSIIQHKKNELLNFSSSQTPSHPQYYQISPEHLQNVKDFILKTNMSSVEISQTLFGNNWLQTSGFGPEFRLPTESDSDNEDENEVKDEDEEDYQNFEIETGKQVQE